MSTKTKIQGGIGHEHYISKLSMRGHLIVTDEPLEKGGKDAGPTPTELVLSGLAACTASTLRMYADKKGWDVERIDLEVSIRIQKTDAGQISQVESLIDITGNITAGERARMIEIAQKCPVHKLLSNPIEILTSLKG